MSLSAETRTWLLEWARLAIRQELSAGELLPPASHPREADELRGCFVTLHTRDGSLRGCIGTFEESKSLWQNVAEMARAAATRDRRFEPLRADELEDCVLEISALTPRREARPEQIRVGVDGLWIQRGYSRGVLLPQVATEHGLDAEEFLEHTCLKAGLPKDAWRDPETQLMTFGAEVFGEEAEVVAQA